MARKKLNKKLAIFGLLALAVFVLGAMFLILHLSRDPDKFIKDAEKSLQAGDYENATESYRKALARVRKDSIKLEILFKLTDIYQKADDWRNVMLCWETIVSIEPTNVEVRLQRLRYYYILANSGLGASWQVIETQATEFLDLIDKNILSENLSKWKSFDINEKPLAQRLDCYLYLLRGRAIYERIQAGQETAMETLYSKAVEDLQKAREIEPNNINVSWYLAQAVLLRGDRQALRGNTQEQEKAMSEAQAILEQTVRDAQDDVKAYTNLLSLKLVIADRKGVEEVSKLEPEFLGVTQKFGSSAEAFARLSEFYLLLGPKYISKAAEAVEKAITLDKQNILYLSAGATIYYYKYALDGRQSQEFFNKSVETAEYALKLPDAQETTGPRRWANLKNRLTLYEFLVSRYFEQIHDPKGSLSESQKAQLLAQMENGVGQIEQILGTGENIVVTKWRGMLDIARGNKTEGIRKLYGLYEQLTATGKIEGLDPQIAYVLAKEFENTNEQGSVVMFLANALSSGIARWSRPEALLEYCETLLKLGAWPLVKPNLDLYEKFFEVNQKSRTIRILADIGAGQYEEAQRLLAAEPADNPNTIKLQMALVQAKIKQVRSDLVQLDIEIYSVNQAGKEILVPKEQKDRTDLLKAELASHQDNLADLAAKLYAADVKLADETYISTICENYIFDGKYKEASAFADMSAKYMPNNVVALFYKRLTSDVTDANSFSSTRRKGVEEAVLKEVPDPFERAINLGVFYRKNNDLSKAAEQFKIAIGDYLTSEQTADKSIQNEKIIQQKKAAVDYLFNIALEQKDWQIASQIRESAKRKDIDGCEGMLYTARLAASQKDPKALEFFNDCLKKRPVFSYGYLLRSNVYAALGDEKAAIDDAQKAVLINPVDGIIAKNLVSLLYQRNMKLGKSASEEQKEQFKAALDSAMRANSGDMDLFSFYAEFISSTEPFKALSIRQYLMQSSPSIDNAVMLGRMATNIALQQKDEKTKQVLFDVALFALGQARKMDPNNKQAIQAFADYYSARGEQAKAEQVIKESNNQMILWAYYYNIGQYDQAEKILKQLYDANPKDTSVLKGLTLICEKTINKEGAQKYSGELLALDDSMENNLLQISIFFNVGLVKEAEAKLQSFREKYPDEPEAHYIEAWLLMRQGRLPKALEVASRGLEKDRNNPLMWQTRGKIYLLMGNYESAVNDFDRSKLLSNDPETRLLEAKAYLGIGRDENAITELKSVADDPALAMEARILLERVYLKLGRKDALREFYTDTVQKFPENVYWGNKAGKFSLMAGDLKTAEQLYQRAWQQSEQTGNGNRESLNGYLESLILSRQFDKLFEVAKKYINTDYAPIAYIEMADAEKRLGNKEKSIEYARLAADKAQNNEAVLYEVLKALFQIIGRDEVEKYCTDNISKNPNSIPAYLMMASMKMYNNEYDKAVQNIEKCIELAQTNPDKKQTFLINKAVILYQAYLKTTDKNYLTKTINTYESLLAELPKKSSAEILNNLAFMVAESGEKYDSALNYIKQADELKPNTPDFLDTYAYVLYKNGQYNEADEKMQAALQLFEARQMKPSWQMYERSGEIKEKIKANMQAVVSYKRALEAAGEGEMTTEDIDRIKAAIDRVSPQNN